MALTIGLDVHRARRREYRIAVHVAEMMPPPVALLAMSPVLPRLAPLAATAFPFELDRLGAAAELAARTGHGGQRRKNERRRWAGHLADIGVAWTQPRRRCPR